jgi:CBS domain-containing protein
VEEVAPNLIHTGVLRLSTEPIVISSSAPLTKAIGALKEKKAYELFVAEESKIGMISIRDILKSRNVHSRKVSSLLISIPTLSPGSELGEAARMMTDCRVRALPIVDGGKITGQLTAVSICEALNSDGKLDFAVNKIMTKDPVTIEANDPLGKAKTLMNQKNVDHLPVLEQGKAVGVLTSQRILDTLIPPESPMMDKTPETRRVDQLSVKGLIESPCIADVQETASSILSRLIERGMTCALVYFGDELQGIVTYRDFVKLLGKRTKTGPPVYIVGLPDDPFEAELARAKFSRAVILLTKHLPEILEARATLKTTSSLGKRGRRRYEVKASIYTPRKIFTYSQSGWDLTTIFDQISKRLSRIMTGRRKSEDRKERRNRE